MSLLRLPAFAAALAVVAGCDVADHPATPTTAGAGNAAIAACPTCVVGPLVLTRRAGAPDVHSWPVPATPGGRWTLHLDDFGTQGANAEVRFNGVPIEWRTDSSGARRHRADIVLEMRAENTLVVRLTGKPGSQLTVSLEPAPALVTLTVAIGATGFPPTSGALQGPANGRVTAPGIDCTLVDDVPGGDCSEAYAVGTIATVVRTPAPRSIFWEWYFSSANSPVPHACAQDANGDCVVTMASDTMLHAVFAPAPSRLEVTLVGPGLDASVNGNEIMCDLVGGVQSGMCAQNYFGGILSLPLRAYPKNTRFVGWSGACSGTELTCPVTSQPGDTVRVTATFAAP